MRTHTKVGRTIVRHEKTDRYAKVGRTIVESIKATCRHNNRKIIPE